MIFDSYTPEMMRREAERVIREVRQHHRIHAPDFPEDCHWLNASPLSLQELRGKVVLLDFWTYCCVNCLHVLPDMAYLEKKYSRAPFVVIGVHSGKFDNEKDPDNVKEAVLRHHITHPVVVDDNYKIWESYGVKAWPTSVLIDPEGYVIASFSGEGNRDILENYIDVLLEQFQAEHLLNYQPVEIDLETNYQYRQILNYPMGVLADDAGNRLLIADTQNHRILVCSLDGVVTEVIGAGESGFVDGDFTTALFAEPIGMALYKDTLLVADSANHAIRKIDFTQQKVKTIAGTGVAALPRQKTAERMLTSGLNSPWDVLVLGDFLYIAMAGFHQIWRMNLRTLELEVYAGSGREAKRDDVLPLAMFAQPAALCSDGERYIFIADSESSTVRRIDIQREVVETIAGGDLFVFGDIDGGPDKSLLQHPMGIDYIEGQLYLADTYNHKIKKVDPQSGKVQTFAGQERGEMDGKVAAFFEPCGLTHAAGRLYVEDCNNHKIRIVDLVDRSVSTLKIRGLGEVLARRGRGKLMAANNPMEEIALPRTVLKADTDFQLTIHIHLPDGHAFNGGSPFEYSLIADGELLSGDICNEINTLSRPQEQFKLTCHTGALHKQGTILLELRYFYCSRGEVSVCKMRQVQFRIPALLSVTGKSQLKIDEYPE